jgi:hypothetical protein
MCVGIFLLIFWPTGWTCSTLRAGYPGSKTTAFWPVNSITDLNVPFEKLPVLACPGV